MTPAFTDREAERRWRLYFERVDRLVGLTGGSAADVRDELEDHLAESFSLAQEAGEIARLDAAIRRLGEPEDYLRPLVADGLIERATARLDPVALARGLYHAIRLGSARMAVGVAFAIGYLTLFAFIAMALLRPLWGGHVGLYRWPDGTIQFGFLRDTTAAVDLLGDWTIPAVLAASGLIYLSLTRGLRRVWRQL